LSLARLAAAREPQNDVGITLTRRVQRSETSTMAAESQICHYRRVRLFPGARVNLSKSGASVSIGRRRGAWYTVGPRGRQVTVGLPGTGISTGPSRFRTSRSAPLGGRFAFIVGAAIVALCALAVWSGR
jgi:hypothetical protein